MDILSGLPTTKDKYKLILVLVDSYSKWVELFPLRTQEATEVDSVLFTEKKIPLWGTKGNTE